jgi:hypothetical protein
MKRRPNHAITKSIENLEFLTYRLQKIQNQKKIYIYAFNKSGSQLIQETIIGLKKNCYWIINNSL